MQSGQGILFADFLLEPHDTIAKAIIAVPKNKLIFFILTMTLLVVT